jgi:hypothetical protein
LENDEIRMTAEALRDVYGAMETNDDPEGVFPTHRPHCILTSALIRNR